MQPENHNRQQTRYGTASPGKPRLNVSRQTCLPATFASQPAVEVNKLSSKPSQLLPEVRFSVVLQQNSQQAHRL